MQYPEHVLILLSFLGDGQIFRLWLQPLYRHSAFFHWKLEQFEIFLRKQKLLMASSYFLNFTHHYSFFDFEQVHDNSFTGSIPESIGSWSNMQYFSVSKRFFTSFLFFQLHSQFFFLPLNRCMRMPWPEHCHSQCIFGQISSTLLLDLIMVSSTGTSSLVLCQKSSVHGQNSG